MTLLRTQLGNSLRSHRLRQRRTLRDVSGAARVSLGYLSEVERGQKEASSELLASICDALELELADLLAEVSDRPPSRRTRTPLGTRDVSSCIPCLPVGSRFPQGMNAADASDAASDPEDAALRRRPSPPGERGDLPRRYAMSKRPPVGRPGSWAPRTVNARCRKGSVAPRRSQDRRRP